MEGNVITLMESEQGAQKLGWTYYILDVWVDDHLAHLHDLEMFKKCLKFKKYIWVK